MLEKLNFVVENQLGLLKDNEEFKNALNSQFNGETAEVGLYLAMARVAQRAGHPEIAEVLKVIAWEEAEHAAQYAELMGKISDCTKTNITKMMNGEVGANKLKAELAQKAKDAGLKVDEKALADYVKTIIAASDADGANKFFAKEENIYKMLGVGNVTEGKEYFLNQDAVRNYVVENYK